MQEDEHSASIFEAALRLHDSLRVGDVAAGTVRAFADLLNADAVGFLVRSDSGSGFELIRGINESVLGFGAAEGGSGRVEGTEVCPASTLRIPLRVPGRELGEVLARRRWDESRDGFSPYEKEAAALLGLSAARALANALDFAEATRQTLIDDLTRLYNLRYLYQTLEHEIRRSRRYSEEVSVIFIDLDGFKRVNDVYGHRAGSATLTEVAEVVRRTVREADFVARFGGDEFVVMLPSTPPELAAEVADRVRARIASHGFSGGIGADIRLTASFGVAGFPRHGGEAGRLIELADAAMYDAKQDRKNAVRLAADRVG